MNINRNLTRDFILSRVDEVNIFSKYLDIDIHDIRGAINKNLLIESPFRYDDNIPSMGFKYNPNGKLKGRDFSGYFWGDCFDAVAFQLRLNVRNKEHFILILKDIAARFGIRDAIGKTIMPRINLTSIKELISRKHIFEVCFRDWNGSDIAYWGKLIKAYDVTEYMTDNMAYPIQHLWIDRGSQPEPRYTYTQNDPAYDYYFGKDDLNIDNHKIYFPRRTFPKPRFMTNCNAFQNYSLIEDDWDALLITKSYKDVLSIKSFLPDYIKIEVIAPPAENHIFTKEMYDWFASRTRMKFEDGTPAIFSLFDFDRAGLTGSGRLKRDFKVQRLMFTNGKRNTLNSFPAKDFTDNVVILGKDTMSDNVMYFIETLLTIIQ